MPLQANKGKGLEQLKAAIARVLDHARPIEGRGFREYRTRIDRLHALTERAEPIFLMRGFWWTRAGTGKTAPRKYGANLAASGQRLANA